MRVTPAGVLRLFGQQGRTCTALHAQHLCSASNNHVFLGAAKFVTPRAFASAAGSKIANTLKAELKHEEENVEQSKEIKAFLKDSTWKFVDAEGNVNMMLEKEAGSKIVQIEWQLTSPFDPSADEGGEPQQEATDFSVTVQNKDKNVGITFYCSTQAGEDHRYVIGNVRSFSSAEEKDSVSAYNGPEFEDVEEKLQEALDEYLLEMGVDGSVCDFIDAMALDKEQREYVRWLKNTLKFTDA